MYPLTRSTSRSRFFGLPFSPSVLFAAGEQGAWYDPSDYSTLFQDVAGTTPVTGVEQFVRLMLDKSKGLVLGPELATNGDFSGGATGWIAAAGVSFSGGTAVFTAVASTSALYQAAAVSVGSWYEVTVVVSSFTSGQLRARLFGGLAAPVDITAAGTYTFRDVVTSANTNVGFATPGATTCVIDSFSIKLLPGNHATAPSDPARPILRARYNRLTYTEDLSNAAWTKQAILSVTASGTDVFGVPRFNVIPNTSNDGHNVRQTINIAGTKTISCVAKPNGYKYIFISDNVTGSVGFTLTGSGAIYATSGGATGTITALSDGSYLCAATIPSTASSLCLIAVKDAANFLAFAGDGVSGVLISRPDDRVTNDALNQPAYQRVGAATDYDTAGFLPYLEFNGSTWSMSTAAIDFSGTDKMTVFAGVRKIVGSGFITELSSATFSNAGAFGLSSAGWFASNPAKYGTSARGNASVNLDSETQASTFAPPISNVVTASYNIAGVTNADAISMRVDGSSTALNYNLGPLAGGNFGNHPLFIGARNNASLWFTGRIYSLTIVGRAVNSGELAAMEAYVNQKTAAY